MYDDYDEHVDDDDGDDDDDAPCAATAWSDSSLKTANSQIAGILG